MNQDPTRLGQQNLGRRHPGASASRSGLLVSLRGSPPELATPNKFQLVMWLIAPIWLTTLSLCFFFSSGMRAWLWLGGENLLAYAGLFACRFFLR